MRICKAIEKRTGIQNFRSHILRHSRARWLFDQRYVPETVQKFLRHKDILTTLKYNGTFVKEQHYEQIMSLPKPNWVLG
jgi:integrase